MLNSSIRAVQESWNPPIAESCQLGVSQYCPNVEAGKGRLVRCLMEHIPSLENSCQKRIYSLKLNSLSTSPDKYLLFLLQSFLIFGGVFGLLFLAKVETNFKTLPIDSAFFSIDLLLIRLISLFIVMSLLHLMIEYLPISFFINAEGIIGWLPKDNWVRLAAYIMMVDFIGYFSHRTMHSKLLWRFHKVHHSSTDLQWHSNFRNHPINTIIQSVVITLPLMLLNMNKLTYVFFLSYMVLFDAYAHSSFRICKKLKWLVPIKYLIVTPEFHRLHHLQSNNRKHQNYAGIFSFWDYMFKTSNFEFNDNRPMGVASNYPQSFWYLLVAPFRKRND